MVDIESWLNEFTAKMENTFKNRIEFIGLQGSYGRQEATDSSDIDVVVIFDELDMNDLKKYNDVLLTLPHRDLVCGFVSGKNELLNWEKSDLFQFYFDTKPVVGDVDYLLPLIDDESILRAIRIGACNIYHMCVHNILHEKDIGILKSLFKSASFVVQAIHYHNTHKYIKKREELLVSVSEKERKILQISSELKLIDTINKTDFEQFSEQLFLWTKELIEKYRR